ncbi:MAG TPA: hypothetical protein VJ397_04565 [Thermoplasmata archaeon]|nr:hypothetical protein [Thermoplasmata archaeon]
MRAQLFGGGVLATAGLIGLLMAGAAVAGTFQYMKVDGQYVPLTGCNWLQKDSVVEGEYVPDDPGNSVSFQWQLNSLGWHSFSASQGLNGVWGFQFTMTEDLDPYADDTLYIEANDDGTTYPWSCTNYS